MTARKPTTDEAPEAGEEVTEAAVEALPGHVQALPTPEAVPLPSPPDEQVNLVARVPGQIEKGDQVATPGFGVDLIDLGDGEVYDVDADGKVVGAHKSK